MVTRTKSWCTRGMRRHVVTKINDLRKDGVCLSKSSVAIENIIFKKARTKEEYVERATLLVLRLRDHARSRRTLAESRNLVTPEEIASAHGFEVAFHAPMREEMDNDNSWRTSTLRHTVVAKLNDELLKNGIDMWQYSVELEDSMYQQATTEEQYFELIATIIVYLRNMSDYN